MEPPPRGNPDPDPPGWIQALKRHEPWAWDRLQAKSLDTVFGYLVLRCDRREDAEDLTSEVFAAAVTAIGSFRGEAQVETWLVSIARRKLLDAARRRRRRPEVLEAELSYSAGDAVDLSAAFPVAGDLDDPEGSLLRREQIAQIRRAVTALPELQREVLWLRCVHELSVAETARVVRRSENAVKALLHRARASLHARLTGEPRPSSRESSHVETSVPCIHPPAAG